MAMQMAKKNIIILTNGLSGSSVLTALIARAGYWQGDNTLNKSDYPTHESANLVGLNRQIMEYFGFGEIYQHQFSASAVNRIAENHQQLNKKPFQQFFVQCQEHRPWIWKDPRLWATIRFWQQSVDLSSCQFILLFRDFKQSWISATLRRHIQSPAYCRNYDSSIQNSLRTFIVENNLPSLELLYEDLILQPEVTLAGLNQFIGSQLSLTDLQQIYRGKLYELPRGKIDGLKAWAIYLKNYPYRRS